jgi:ABC-type polysaccharide/polyol phosphate transport system ATPase subunit
MSNVPRGAIQLRAVKKTFPAYHADTIKGALARLARGQPVIDRRTVLDGVSLAVKPGERVGIVGKNGAGKSTLFRLMAGILAPDEGVVELGGRVSPLIEITAGMVIDMTGAENIRLNASILGLTRRQTEERFDDIVRFADIADFVDTPVRYYSSGMLARLGFSIAVHVDADIMLIDEVLAVGDAAFQARCLERLHAAWTNGTTIVLVSHDLAAVRRHTERVVWIENGAVRADGATAEISAEYEASAAPSPGAALEVEPSLR